MPLGASILMPAEPPKPVEAEALIPGTPAAAQVVATGSDEKERRRISAKIRRQRRREATAYPNPFTSYRQE